MNSDDLQDVLLLQKISILMRCSQILENQEFDTTEAAFIQEALHNGHLWALHERYDALSEHTSKEVVKEVRHILHMWRTILWSFDELSDADKECVRSRDHSVQFPGFDNHGEITHLVVATFLVEHMREFQELKGCDLDSHQPLTLQQYRRMLTKYVRRGTPMSKDEIVALVQSG